ncbi:MAG: MBL fold metallo-hydrolase [Acidilobaceae archaeon]
MVNVIWHGHACVEVRLSSGLSIVFDPHDGASLGIPKPKALADIVLISHDHFDHNATSAVAKPQAKVFKMSLGEIVLDSIKIEGLPSYHDKSKGAQRGTNVIYVLEAEQLKLVHLGDLGDEPEPPVLTKISEANLLIVPVGGTFTIGPSEAWQLVEKTRPINVMPIHYATKGLRLPLRPVDDFLKQVKKGYEVKRLEVNSFNLKDYKNTVIVPKPPV